ncbi:Zinc finger C2CH-type [Trinorchestia longiramus]|nr:Zinc finger C2CH-type [Trinorchestia longiramus]
MPNKCGIVNCRANYNKENRRRVFCLPKEQSERQNWLDVLPPRENFVVNPDKFFICEIHWGADPSLIKLRGGSMRPGIPSSIFNVPASCLPSPKLTPRPAKVEDQQLRYLLQKDKITSFDTFKPGRNLQKQYKNLIICRSKERLVCLFMTDNFSECSLSVIVENKPTLCSPLTLINQFSSNCTQVFGQAMAGVILWSVSHLWLSIVNFVFITTKILLVRRYLNQLCPVDGIAVSAAPQSTGRLSVSQRCTSVDRKTVSKSTLHLSRREDSVSQRCTSVDGKTVSRRQSIPCLPADGTCTGSREDCSRTLPRNSATGSKQRLKSSNESLRCSRESCSASMFDIPSSDVQPDQQRCTDTRCPSQQQECQYRPELQHRTLQHPNSFMSPEGAANPRSDSWRSSESPPVRSSPCHQPQLADCSDNFAKQQDQLEQLQSQRSFSPVSSFLLHQRVPRIEGADAMPPYGVLPACPPQFQNEVQPLEVPDPPPPPRVTAHMVQQQKLHQKKYPEHQHQPSTTSSSSSTVSSSRQQHQVGQQMQVSQTQASLESTALHHTSVTLATSTSSQPIIGAHQQHRPRHGEKRVTIKEEVHKL